MLIIFEGPDRVGKTTAINNIKNILAENGYLVHILHYKNFNIANVKEYSIKLYKSMFDITCNNKEINKNNEKIIFLADRFHLGEYVYGKLYRNYGENYNDIFNIENENSILFVFIDNVENLILREDGNSFSKLDKNAKQKEINLFIEAYKKSKIKNKLLINVGNKTIDDVKNQIIEYIKKNKII